MVYLFFWWGMHGAGTVFGALTVERCQTVQELQEERVRQQELVQKQQVPRDPADSLTKNWVDLVKTEWDCGITLKEHFFKVLPF